MGAEPFLPIDYSIVKRKSELWLRERINTNWRATTTGSQMKLFIDSQSDKLTKQLISLDKSSIRIAVGLLTGHAKVNYHLKKMGIRDDPDCRLCGRAEEKTSHLLCECLSLRRTRLDCLEAEQIIPSLIPQNIYKIIEFYNTVCELDPRLASIF